MYTSSIFGTDLFEIFSPQTYSKTIIYSIFQKIAPPTSYDLAISRLTIWRPLQAGPRGYFLTVATLITFLHATSRRRLRRHDRFSVNFSRLVSISQIRLANIKFQLHGFSVFIGAYYICAGRQSFKLGADFKAISIEELNIFLFL